MRAPDELRELFETHLATVSLHPEVQVTVKANVARSPDEANQQAQGIDVIAAMFEEDTAPTGFIEAIDPTLEPGEFIAPQVGSTTLENGTPSGAHSYFQDVEAFLILAVLGLLAARLQGGRHHGR